MKVNVHIGFELEELKSLDEWREARRLTRGAAIMTLLDLARGLESEKQQKRPERIVEPTHD